MIKVILSRNKSLIFVFLGLFISSTLMFSQNSKSILAIGDSNGALNYGWVNQLQEILPNDKIYNTSISGNTIGFDNLGRDALNTLKNLDNYLKSSEDSLGGIDYILIMLGTNDAKYLFKDRQEEVILNMQILITRINNYAFNVETKPRIIIMSPPPYGSDKIVEKKYQGGAKRVRRIANKFKKIATTNDCGFVNVHKALNHVFDKYSKDGVHLEEEGQKTIAALVANQLLEK